VNVEDEHGFNSNNLRTVTPSFRSTAVRSYPALYDSLRSAISSRTAEEFLVNSRLRRGDVDMAQSVKSYMTEPTSGVLSRIGRNYRRGSCRISLPPSVELQISLAAVLQRRRSTRKYTGEAIPLAHVATIIRAACAIGENGNHESDSAFAAPHRVAPSGGGLYPVELYIASLRVENLARATYVYDPYHDVLWQTGDEAAIDALLASLALPGKIITEDKAGAICLLIGHPWRSMRKYGDRGMRYVFLEAGAMAEHISLAAGALGIGDVHCGSLYDDEAHEALQIDGLYEALIHCVFLGVPG